MPREQSRETLRLSDACRALRLDYQSAYRAVVSGKIPAERDARGTRWLIQARDLPAIAEALGGTAD